MAFVQANSTDLGYAGLLMKAADFFALGETAERYELVNGVVVMSPSPRPRHWAIIEEVLLQLRAHAKGRGSIETYAEIDLFIDDVTVYRPDLCVYARPRSSRVPDRLTLPPQVILEVLSPGSKPLDLITKRDAYEKFGVKEYWTIDQEDGRVRAWRQEGGRLLEMREDGDFLASFAVSGFMLDLRPIREIVSG